MKKRIMLNLLILMTFVVTFSGTLLAETVFYEPFNYGLQGLLQDLSNWTKVEGNPDRNCEMRGTNLRYGNMPVSGGYELGIYQ